MIPQLLFSENEKLGEDIVEYGDKDDRNARCDEVGIECENDLERLVAECGEKRRNSDTKAELDLVEAKCKELGVNVRLSEVWAKGGEGGAALAEEVVRLVEQENNFSFVYPDEATIEEKLEAIVKRVYHGDGVVLTANAKKQAEQLTALGFGNLPICMAKTQYSFSDNAALLGAPKGFKVTVRNLKVCAGAGFIVALTGDIMTMPGLPKVPSAEKIDVDETGKISGLF